MLNTSDFDQSFPLLGIQYRAIPAYRIRRMYKIFIITFLIVKIINNLNVNTRTGYYVELSISVPFEKKSSPRHIKLKKRKYKFPSKCLLATYLISHMLCMYSCVCIHVQVCLNVYMYLQLRIIHAQNICQTIYSKCFGGWFQRRTLIFHSIYICIVLNFVMHFIYVLALYNYV